MGDAHGGPQLQDLGVQHPLAPQLQMALPQLHKDHVILLRDRIILLFGQNSLAHWSQSWDGVCGERWGPMAAPLPASEQGHILFFLLPAEHLPLRVVSYRWFAALHLMVTRMERWYHVNKAGGWISKVIQWSSPFGYIKHRNRRCQEACLLWYACCFGCCYQMAKTLGWRRLAVGGWWQLAVGGGWWAAVGGPLGRSLRAVLSKKKKI